LVCPGLLAGNAGGTSFFLFIAQSSAERLGTVVGCGREEACTLSLALDSLDGRGGLVSTSGSTFGAEIVGRSGTLGVCCAPFLAAYFDCGG